MNPLVIAHAEDPDGLISRALLQRALLIDDKDPQDHIFVRYDRLVESFQEAVEKARTHKAIYVADLSINDRLLQRDGDSALLEQLVSGKTLHWFDHHDSTAAHHQELIEQGITVQYHKDKCASLLVAHYFCLGHPYEKMLGRVAQASDYPGSLHDPAAVRLGNGLERIIALANETMDYGCLLDLACDLRDEKCFDRQMQLSSKWQEHLAAFIRRESQAYAELTESVQVISQDDRQIVFGYASPLLSPKPGPSYLREQYRDIAEIFICLFKPPVRNHLIFICEDSSFPVVPFVRSLGGGGRENGGGFTLDYDVTPENYPQVKEMLLEKMEKYE
ncbi:MAG TPA: hypothetical protein VJC21_00465 [Candidatus Nanoarchaeia archaeon]|nr:hypothetical protein [Candidatus Nanoarchaeia archaeon]